MREIVLIRQTINDYLKEHLPINGFFIKERSSSDNGTFDTTVFVRINFDNFTIKFSQVRWKSDTGNPLIVSPVAYPVEGMSQSMAMQLAEQTAERIVSLALGKSLGMVIIEKATFKENRDLASSIY